MRTSRKVSLVVLVVLALTAGASASALASVSVAKSATSTQTIKLMVPSAITGPVGNPGRKEGAEAAVQALNKAGGKYKYELEVCDHQADVNKNLACANQAVSDGVVAIVGAQWTNPAVVPILLNAGIVNVPGPAQLPTEMQSANTFPFGGSQTFYTGMAAQMLSAGVKKPALIRISAPVGDIAAQVFTSAFKTAGISLVHSVAAPIGTTDFSSIAAAASADGVDGIALVLQESSTYAVIKSLRQAGYQGTINALGAALSSTGIAATGSLADGVQVTGSYAPISTKKNNGVKQYLRDMKAYNPDASLGDPSMSAWADTILVDKVAQTIKEPLTAPLLLKAFQALKPASAIDLGVVAPVPGASVPPVPQYPTTSFNPTVVFGEIKNGKIVSVGKTLFENPYDYLATFAKTSSKTSKNKTSKKR